LIRSTNTAQIAIQHALCHPPSRNLSWAIREQMENVPPNLLPVLP